MCGIVGAISERNISPILLAGLKRLEYRGYDSAGLAVIDPEQRLQRLRTLGKVAELETALQAAGVTGYCGIAHTRWATHGQPSVANAHPQQSNKSVAVVHNGIIENYQALREQLLEQGYAFSSDTDTEVIAHLIHQQLEQQSELLPAVQHALQQLEGAYAIAVISARQPQQIIASCKGSPLVLGLGFNEYFLASDANALLPFTQQHIYLEDNDSVLLQPSGLQIFNAAGEPIERPTQRSELEADVVSKGPYKHYMLKEIYEQPVAVANTLQARLGEAGVLPGILGAEEARIFPRVQAIKILACGTSYHAGSVAKLWIEKLANLPCSVEIASEFRYRRVVMTPNTLVVTISQSGETADTLAALKYAQQRDCLASLAICNVPASALVRASDLVLMTRAGPEIGVASTKAFTTQLSALLLLTLALAHYHYPNPETAQRIATQLRELPAVLEATLGLDSLLRTIAEEFIDKQHTLFLGRGTIYPIALEGALKLKEISYIHAEGYAAGELKHGPLALVDQDMPVIAVAPNNELMDKLKSNLQEVRARQGQLYVFADRAFGIESEPGIRVIEVPSCSAELAPIVFTVPLQLLSYHIAVLRGTDVDQPRNLAKSVTVE